MTFTRVLAQATVSDLDRAVAWYATLFGRDPDARPMTGLAEWHLGESMGVQVWTDPERAGGSTMVIDESDLDGLAARLEQAGVDHAGTQPASSFRVLPLEDPDGNRVVLTGA
jgi:catechol 2,3-dioxygenase-like lactoylglutathione lyase family enzyme